MIDVLRIVSKQRRPTSKAWPLCHKKPSNIQGEVVQIQEATIHQLIKESKTSGKDSVQVKPRTESLPLDDVLKQLCTGLVELYGKTANSNGTLGIDPVAHKFPQDLRAYVDGKTEFLPFTCAAVEILAEKMSEEVFANGGYALFLRYAVDEQDFVLVVMLKLKPGAGIDEKTLALQATLNIDLGKLHEAARINLTRWNAAQQPYLTFIKGQTKKNDVNAYFRAALACTGYTDSKHHTEAVIRAAKEFVEGRTDLETPQAKSDERIAMTQRLYQCLAANPFEVPLLTVAAAIFPGAPEEFVDFVKNKADTDGFHLDDRFAPHRQTYSALKRLTGKMGTVSLSFDVADVRNELVVYDEVSDTIVLKSPSDHLKKAIRENA